jgi:hypothetical protein
VVHSRRGSSASPKCDDCASIDHNDDRAGIDHDGCSCHDGRSIFQSIFANVDYFAGTSACSCESVAKGINADRGEHINCDR